MENSSITNILDKSKKGEILTKEDAMILLNIPNSSADFYRLIATSNVRSREQFQNKGDVFVQIGLNSAPCSGNCKFCSIGKDQFSHSLNKESEKAWEEIEAEVTSIMTENITALFLMTTADYDQQKFLEIGKKVRTMIPNTVDLVANVGDFDVAYAHKLKAAGFTGVYHIVRLREGIDTDLPIETRIATLDAAQEAGIPIYYCVEPIGPEHSYEEMIDEMIRARNYKVDVMAVMRRVNVEGTDCSLSKEVTELEMTKIAAVARLVTNPGRSMNVHEPMKMPLLAGVNQLYAEIGINPRDTASQTESSRGMSIAQVKKMLRDAEYIVD